MITADQAFDGAPLLRTEFALEPGHGTVAGAEQKAAGGLGPTFFAEQGWGFGGAVRKGRYGWNGGLGTSWLIDPARDLTVIALTQREFESAEGPAAHRDLQAEALAACR
jgi:CubicO group peptidase (beta-lactamase class C family)